MRDRPRPPSLQDLAALRHDGPGAARFGSFDPETDPRDMAEEIREELADAWNYCAFHAQQRRRGRAARWLLRIALRVAWWAVERIDSARRGQPLDAATL